MDAVIGLGSNLGDSRANLGEALRRIAALGRIRALSALYETEPVGPAQPLFHNAALLLSTELSPEALLEELLGIERALGRVRTERWGPRLIDLDILWIRDRVVSTPNLRVPHSELRRRAFALVPLLDLVPDAADPADGARYAEVLSRNGASGVREIPGSRGSWG